MFERYTEKARRVIFFARYEASQFGASAIEPEHILLGLLREDAFLLRRYLPRGGVDSLREEVATRIDAKEKFPTSVDIPVSPAAKRVLNHANEASEQLQQRHVGTEHLLVGLLREGKSLAAHGITLDTLEEEDDA